MVSTRVSALSPYVFDIVMDVITSEVREEVPWCAMFADDIVLVDFNKRRCPTQARKMERKT